MFFVRKYNSGEAKSGTTDIVKWESFPSWDEFKFVCESHGEGKYIMFERGKGIRGMRKVNEYVVEQKNRKSDLKELLVFAAEEFGVDTEKILSVKQQIPIQDMNDDDLFEALDTMTKSAESDSTLGQDIKAIINELKGRAVGNNSVKEAETVKGLTNKLGGFGGGFLVGGLSGVAVTAYHYRGKIQDMESRLSAMETSMKETESELRKESEERKRQQKANEAVRNFDNGLRMDNAFLSEYNRKNRTTDFLG